jgi:hypothetical protein
MHLVMINHKHDGVFVVVYEFDVIMRVGCEDKGLGKLESEGFLLAVAGCI